MSTIRKIIRNDNGTYTASWALTEEQMAWLLTYAINELVSQGEVDVEIESQQQLELNFLEGLPKEELGNPQ